MEKIKVITFDSQNEHLKNGKVYDVISDDGQDGNLSTFRINETVGNYDKFELFCCAKNDVRLKPGGKWYKLKEL